MKVIYSIAMFTLINMLSACASMPVESKTKTLYKNTELLIGEYAYWRRDCEARHFDISIEQYPQGGDLRFEVGTLMVPENPEIGSAGNCAGKEVQSKKVIYVANPDFVGQDALSFVIDASFLLGKKAFDFNINVK